VIGFIKPPDLLSSQLHHALIPRDYAPVDRLFEITALTCDFRVSQLPHYGWLKLSVVLQEIDQIEWQVRGERERVRLKLLA
jgi:hypothetical protein